VQQVSASAIFNAAGLDFAREMTDTDIERVTADFAAAARLAIECGFDVIQIHCGHGYLLSQFLSPSTNWRTDGFGCSSTGTRVQFPLQVCRRVRAAVGPDVPICVKMNMHDGFAGGVRLEHAISFAQCLEQSGLVDLIIPSGGWVSKNGFFMLRGEVPLLKMALAQRKGWVQSLALLALGPFLVPRMEWTSSFFSADARVLKAHLTKTPVCLLGGIESLDAVEEALAQGFVAVAVARAILREPRFVSRLRRESTERHVVRQSSPCTHCNECIVSSAMSELPVRCTITDY
jgi:2,4-dienoyl-CoA reductase-like NADH-dependent reductase (Old Yellow Enzyme family)